MGTWGPFDLGGKNAIVTGGAMGIGFGIVKRFVEGGANVLIADLDEETAEKAAATLSGGPGRVISMRADMADTDTGGRIVNRCIEEFGSVEVLVNNAGIYPVVPMLQMTPELFDKVYAINLKGLAFATKAAAAQMIRQGRGGKIINIASVDAFRPSMVGLAAYDASKGGVVMFTKNLALELAPHKININAIAPGGITTEGTTRLAGDRPLTAEQQKQMTEAALAHMPMGMGTPDDIAKVAVFLASSAADYMTGTTVVVDGGFLLT
ncbi:MAG TPA: SDR family oxidoreductase [bacterium]|jgi:2-deoxy-D-gluconate 3-dehydrogenase